MLIRRRHLVAGAGVATLSQYLPGRANAASYSYDVVVYGANMSGIAAAYAAAREGASVAIVVGPDPVGGIVANGLSSSDVKVLTYVGGIALSFYQNLGAAYGTSVAFYYEPHVAGQVALNYLQEAAIPIYVPALAKVRSNGAAIESVQLADGTVLKAKFFIDSSYEGDLMAAANVAYTFGRESNAQYNEPLAGFGIGTLTHSFAPYNANGGLLYGIDNKPQLAVGAADHAVMAYDYRLCVTNIASNMLPYPTPPDYNPSMYLLRLEMLSPTETYTHAGAALPNGKFDVNGGGFMDSDFIGGNWGYPNGDAATRNGIAQAMYRYYTGLLYFLSNDTRVPASYRETFGAYGLAADEFTDNAGWPRCMYVREARRMIGSRILRQQDLQAGTQFGDTIGVGHYNFDCHPAIRYPASQTATTLEGTFVELPLADVLVPPYEIPYRALLPLAAQATNLLVSVCVSASHIAMCSLRMEHHYMIMGEAAGIAAALAVAGGTTAQNVSVSALQTRLLSHGAIISNVPKEKK
jgi:hypothetical protein